MWTLDLHVITWSDVLLPGIGAFPSSSCCFCTSCLSFLLRFLLFFPFPSCPWRESIFSGGCAYVGAGVWNSCDGDHVPLVEVDVSSDFAFSGAEVRERIWSPFLSTKDVTRCWRKVFSISCMMKSKFSTGCLSNPSSVVFKGWAGAGLWATSFNGAPLVIACVTSWWFAPSACSSRVYYTVSCLFSWSLSVARSWFGTTLLSIQVRIKTRSNSCSYSARSRVSSIVIRFLATWGYHFSFLEWVGTSCVPNLVNYGWRIVWCLNCWNPYAFLLIFVLVSNRVGSRRGMHGWCASAALDELTWLRSKTMA